MVAARSTRSFWKNTRTRFITVALLGVHIDGNLVIRHDTRHRMQDFWLTLELAQDLGLRNDEYGCTYAMGTLSAAFDIYIPI